MEVIDLLNKIANKEEMPQKIIYGYCEYVYNPDIQDYQNKDGLELFSYLFSNEENVLLREVEIIEEDKEIEEILIQANREVRYRKDKFIEGLLNHFYEMDLEVREKLNEIIKEVNKIKKEGK